VLNPTYLISQDLTQLGAGVGGVGSAIGGEHLAHDQHVGCAADGVRDNTDRAAGKHKPNSQWNCQLHQGGQHTIADNKSSVGREQSSIALTAGCSQSCCRMPGRWRNHRSSSQGRLQASAVAYTIRNLLAVTLHTPLANLLCCSPVGSRPMSFSKVLVLERSSLKMRP
jgi:hypothetical protein